METILLDDRLGGLWTFYGSSQNDPTNEVDDVDANNELNLYTGVRDPEGRWEVMLYGKYIADNEEVTTRNPAPAPSAIWRRPRSPR